jgi:hypothetical protein
MPISRLNDPAGCERHASGNTVSLRFDNESVRVGDRRAQRRDDAAADELWTTVGSTDRS